MFEPDPELHDSNLKHGVKSESEVDQSYLTLCDPIDCSPPGFLSTGFSRQEYWSGLPFSSPGGLPDPRIEFRSSAFQADSSPYEPTGNPKHGMAHT